MFTLNLLFFLFKVFLSACSCNMKVNLSVCLSFTAGFCFAAYLSSLLMYANVCKIRCIMSFKSKISESAVGLAKAKYTRNFKKTTTRHPNILAMEIAPNESLSKVPSNKNVVGRFFGLHAETKNGANRIKRISEEILKLWIKLSTTTIKLLQICWACQRLHQFPWPFQRMYG